jgi:uncharacterized protein YdeI (YjbR/CyaY-like superfamily)
MNPKIDKYLIDGCMRCKLGGTPDCKVNAWRKELEMLRKIALQCGLAEELKWGVPVYTFQNQNVVLIGAFKTYCILSFFKGALLQDAHEVLSKQGENVQVGRGFKVTNFQELLANEAILKEYIYEAIEIEKAGLKPTYKTTSEYQMPEELAQIFEEDPAFKTAFEALTEGRKRGYLLHFAAPKQSKTRTARIEKCMPLIFEGEGLHDNYTSKKK